MILERDKEKESKCGELRRGDREIRETGPGRKPPCCSFPD